MPIGAIIGGGAALLGGILGGESAEDAANISANAQLQAAQMAAEAQKFRPVGITSRFGTSQFTMSPEGYVTGAGYDVAPDIAAIRDRLLSQAGGQGFQTAEQAQAAQQQLFGLGQQFLPTSTQYQADPQAMAYAARLQGLSEQVLPQSYDTTAAAQQYMQQQQALLQPGRERAQAGLTQNLFNTGRGGLAVAQGGMLGAANPEQQALLNAQAMQDLQLASQAQQQARGNLAQDIQLGTGLGGTALTTRTAADTDAYNRMLKNLQVGSGLFGTGLDLASGGYNPLKTQFGLAQSLEAAGQSPLDLGAQLGGRSAQAGANVGQTLFQGGTNAARAMEAANAYSPVGAAFSGLAGNRQLTQGLANWMTGTPITPQGTYVAGGTGAANPYIPNANPWMDNRDY